MKQSKQKIALIIDDDTDALAYSEVVFGDCGYQTFGYSRFSDFTRNLQHSPDVIVLDLLMPEDDGLQTLHKLARLNIKSPLIILSTSGELVLKAAASVARLLGFEVLGYLRKPYFKTDAMDLLSRSHSGKNDAMSDKDVERLIKNSRVTSLYRPIVNMLNGKVIELNSEPVLLHPRLGNVKPSEFLPLTRSSRLRSMFSSKFLKLILGHCRELNEAGFATPITINLMQEIIGNPGFPDYLSRECMDAKILQSQIVIALNEGTLYGDYLNILTNLTRLSLRGSHIALDNFNSVTSPQGQLSSVPFSQIHLSPELLHGLLNDLDRRFMLDNLVTHCKDQGIDLVVTGIESMEAAGMMMDLGIYHMSGPLFRAFSEFETLLYWMKDAENYMKEAGIITANQVASG